MDDESGKLIIGVIILVLMVNTFAIWSIASVIYSPENQQNETNLNISMAVPALRTNTPTPLPTIIVPEENLSLEPEITTVLSSPEKTETPTIITIETPAVVETFPGPPNLLDEPMVSESEYANLDYITIYSVDNQIINNRSPDVSVNLKNPPLILDFTITPLNITDQKYIEYKLISTMRYENVSINRPFENAWFLVTVIDKNTGKIVTEQGYGRQYGLEPTQHLQVFRSGNYRFDFSGGFVKATLLMRVPRKGNFD